MMMTIITMTIIMMTIVITMVEDMALRIGTCHRGINGDQVQAVQMMLGDIDLKNGVVHRLRRMVGGEAHSINKPSPSPTTAKPTTAKPAGVAGAGVTGAGVTGAPTSDFSQIKQGQ